MKFDFDFLLDFYVVNSLGFLEGVKMPKNDSRVLISKFYYKSRGVFYNKILILWYFYFVLPPIGNIQRPILTRLVWANGLSWSKCKNSFE